MALKQPFSPEQQDDFNKALIKMERDFEARLAALERNAGWEEVHSETLAADTTDWLIGVGAGLSLDADEEWDIELRLELSHGSTTQLRFAPREVETSTNITSTRFYDDVYSNTSNTITISNNLSTAYSKYHADIRMSKVAEDGFTIRGISGVFRPGTGTTDQAGFFCGHDRTTDDLVLFSINSTVSNTIGAGSKIKIFRRRR